MSATISFRVDEEIREGLERQGRNPHEVARQAFLEAVERLEREAALDRLEEAAQEPVEPARNSVERGRP
jgi:predicted transcriptional regulator